MAKMVRPPTFERTWAGHVMCELSDAQTGCYLGRWVTFERLSPNEADAEVSEKGGLLVTNNHPDLRDKTMFCRLHEFEDGFYLLPEED